MIIAHVDHGKSTLADRLLETTGTIEKRLMKAQILDSLESERERGITIKMAPVRMSYTYEDQEYEMNLIDTPGHSDFSYEVSRALAAVEGAVLLVDATQGIQAQTLANYETARRVGLTVIGAVSKVDLNKDLADEAALQLAELLDCDLNNILRVSGKTGVGVEELLAEIVKKVPAPRVDDISRGRALVFDSKYDEHKGVIAFIRVFDGSFSMGQEALFLATGFEHKVKEVGAFYPALQSTPDLSNGEIGYIVTGIKDPSMIKIGDTVVTKDMTEVDYGKYALSGYAEPQPVVFVSFYPQEAEEYDDLKSALLKLRLNDSSVVFEPDTSELLGRGFKCGFLGRLHFEIIVERLQNEFGLETTHSFPSVEYRVKTLQGEEVQIKSPKDFPADYLEAREPIAEVEIVTPASYVGGVLSLNQFFRFAEFDTKNLGGRLLLSSRLPLADLISDLDDRLKSITNGYASLTYKVVGFEKSELTKLEIMVAGHVVPGLTRVLPKEAVEREGRQTVERLKDLLPKQQFVQAVQAYAFGKIIARENVAAMRKDVTGYLYGGDRTRKMKLWKKQQKGKAKMKERAEGAGNSVEIPPSVFKELLKK